MKEDDSLLGQFGTVWDELRSALAFLTRLPPAWTGADPVARPDFTVAARAFPIVGVLIGAAGGVMLLVSWLLGLLPLVGATLAVATTMILTGALHEDGLADFADSFGGSTRERKLEIMDDSRIGTYGAAAVIVSIVLRVGALAAILPRNPVGAVLALIAAEAVSRAAMVRMWRDLPAARASGLASDTGPPEYNAMIWALVVAGVVVVVTTLPAVGWKPTALAVILALGAAYGMIQLVANALGGRTGDTLGACQQVVLAAFLIGASAI